MQLIEIKLPSEPELIQQIKVAERELLMLDKDDNKLAQLSLTIQVYYLGLCKYLCTRRNLMLFTAFL